MKFLLNGKEVESEETMPTYRQLCALAGERVGASMTYRSRYGSGILTDGESLLLDETMVIDAMDTGGA